jgi:hypothetical protein
MTGFSRHLNDKMNCFSRQNFLSREKDSRSLSVDRNKKNVVKVSDDIHDLIVVQDTHPKQLPFSNGEFDAIKSCPECCFNARMVY